MSIHAWFIITLIKLITAFIIWAKYPAAKWYVIIAFFISYVLGMVLRKFGMHWISAYMIALPGVAICTGYVAVGLSSILVFPIIMLVCLGAIVDFFIKNPFVIEED